MGTGNLLDEFVEGHETALITTGHPVPRALLGPLLAMAVLTAGGMLLGWEALDRLNPSYAAFLWRFGPLATILMAVVILGERPSRIIIAPAALMILGGFTSAAGQWNVVGTGTILLLLSALLRAIMLLIAKAKIHGLEPDTIAFYRAAITCVLVAAWGWMTGGLDFHVAAPYWTWTILGALLSPCLGHIVLFHSFRHWHLAYTGIVMTSQPLIVFALAFMFLGSTLSGQEWLGGAMILAGGVWIAFTWWSGRRQPTPPRRFAFYRRAASHGGQVPAGQSRNVLSLLISAPTTLMRSFASKTVTAEDPRGAVRNDGARSMGPRSTSKFLLHPGTSSSGTFSTVPSSASTSALGDHPACSQRNFRI